MLRDLISDLDEGYVNVPREYLEEYNLNPQDIENIYMRAWVKTQVHLAREYFREGKRYLDQLDVLRCKIAGYWYCVRFECVLTAIEKEGFILRGSYNERQKFATRFILVKQAFKLVFQHVIQHPWLIKKYLRNVPKDQQNLKFEENVNKT
jgi:hypothetical protein